MNLPARCVQCHGNLSERLQGVFCKACGRTYRKNRDGYFVFLESETHDPGHIQDEDYIQHQREYPIRVYREFLLPHIRRAGGRRLLDVGCGLGTEVLEALRDGYDAYGVDLPNMTPFWRAASHDATRFLACSAIRLPFPDDFFDLVWSLGVVEHIGTASDTLSLVPEFRTYRADYAREILRVTKPGGKIIVSCPNKTFPIDIQHGPECGHHLKRLRWMIFNKTGLNIHKTWGCYHLLSYAEAKELFMQNPMARAFQPLPLRDYFGFNKFRSGYLRLVRSLITVYVENLPALLRPTFLNPYMLAQVEKK